MVINSKKSLRKALILAEAVYVSPRFGCSEKWVKVPKNIGWALYHDLAEDATPKSIEMGTDEFGHMDGDALYLG